MSLISYSEYEPSSVSWLSQQPKGWQAKPLKTVASINDETLPETTNPEEEIQYVDIGSVSLTNGIEKTEEMTFGSAPSRARRVPRDGDVLVSTVRTYLKAIAPVQGQPGNLVASTGFAVVRAKPEAQPCFLKYALQEEHFIQEIISRSTGVSYPAINASDVGRVLLSLPSKGEQLAIANFLDRETAKIDTLITEQQRLIGLLQEKRQAVISHAVTKGLDPNAPMKDSGVEWLGEVPEHWEVKPLKHLCEIYSGFPFKSDLFQVDGVPVVRMSNISEGAIDLQEAVCVPEHEVPPEALIESGDLLLGLSGSVGNFGIAAESNLPAAVNQRVARIRTYHPILKHFLSSSLYSDQVTCGLPSTTIANVSASQLGNCLLALPPLKEQEQIEVFLHDVYASLDELQASTESSIELLQERRSALISAAVTGQIDVRGLAEEEEP